MNPIPHQKRNHPVTRLMEYLSKLSYAKLFQVWAGMAIGFAVAYFGLSFINGGMHAPTTLSADPDLLHRFFNSLYFSIITATSTGYGDITPQGISKILASLQSMSALFVFAIFVTKLVSHQQELTLTEVHRLTFEDVFHNTREGLYLCRKDFDDIIADANKHKELTAENWENLTTAYRQMQTLLEEIPDFYANEIHRYTIDARREQLLLESVHRSLHRINQMIDAMSENNIDWVSHEVSLNELKGLVKIVNSITPLWKERSPYEALEAFEDIIQLKERMHNRLEGMLPE